MRGGSINYSGDPCYAFDDESQSRRTGEVLPHKMLVTRGSRLRIGRDARGEHREVSFSVSPGQVEFQDHKDGAWSNPRRLQKNVEDDDIEQDWHDQDQSQRDEAVEQE